jgi:hypothetical protein
MKRVFPFFSRFFQSLTQRGLFKSWRGALLEIGLIVSWALFVGAAYLDPNPNLVVPGREWGMSIHTHYLWINFLKCGTCAFWNGSVNGGYPAFTELHGSALHPIVMLATWIFGALEGAEMSLIGAFAVAGIAQWWLSKELGLGRVTRLWVALIAAAGGHIAGRLEHGSFQTAFSTAMCSLVIPAIVATAKGKRYGVPALALTAASAVVSGSGYMQIGIVVGMAPALLFLLFDHDFRPRPLWKKIVLAVGLTLLLSAPLLVPWVNNASIYVKDIEPNFNASQPIGYVILDLFIQDPGYYFADTFWKLPYPYLYTLFIGWIPMVFWCFGLFLSRKEDHRWIGFLVIGAVVELVISSKEFLQTVASFFPIATILRNPSLIAGLAVPFILGVSAIGLDRLTNLNWPNLILSMKNSTLKLFSTKWLLAIPLLMSLWASYDFSQIWLYKAEPHPEIAESITELHTPSAEWVRTPFGEHWFVAPAIAQGLKLTDVFDTFRWEGYEYPQPYLSAERHDASEEPVKTLVAQHYAISIFLDETAEYAYVLDADGEKTACTASSAGGNIDVACRDAPAGRLIVDEKMWSGWKAGIDGEPAELLDPQWLSIETPAGTHTYTFRFRPWDVPLGIGLSVIGLALCIWVYFKSPPSPKPESKDEKSP